jgi:uncharacterized membrane protein YqaE (UPF0057 family)
MLTLLAVACPPAAVLVVDGPRHARQTLLRTLMLYVPGVRDALATVERYTVARQYQPVLERMTATGRG